MGLLIEVIVAIGNLCGVIGAAIFFKSPVTRRLLFPKKTELLVRTLWIVVLSLLGISFLISLIAFLNNPSDVSASFRTMKYIIFMCVYFLVYKAPLNKLDFLARLDTRIRVKEFYYTMDEAQSEEAQVFVYGEGEGRITALSTLKEKDHMVYVVMYRLGNNVTTIAGLEITEDDINYSDDLRELADEDMEIGYTLFRETEEYSEDVNYEKRLVEVHMPKILKTAGIPHLWLNSKVNALVGKSIGGEDGK